jgi:ABC-type transport system involved in multi-copper enzyme maturation permease subunit
MTATATQSVQLSHLPAAVGRAGLRGVIASEFTKIRSVRSTYWTLALLIVISAGIAAAIAAGTSSDLHNNPGNKNGFDATQVSLFAFFELGQLVIAVLGALTITSEYSTGMIRTSLTAMPRRGVVYAGKLIVLTSVCLVVSLVTSFVSFFVGQAILSGTGVSATLFGSVKVPNGELIQGGAQSAQTAYTLVTPSTVLTAIIGTALFVTLVALIAFAVGAILRHSAGAITTVIGTMFVLPIIVQILPHTWRWDIMRFLPDAAGRVISVTVNGGDGGLAHLWSAWPQFGVTAAYAAVLLALGGYLFRNRDA